VSHGRRRQHVRCAYGQEVWLDCGELAQVLAEDVWFLGLLKRLFASVGLAKESPRCGIRGLAVLDTVSLNTA
jgi:hypothetical protein